MTLIFSMEVDLDPREDEIEGQRSRSSIKIVVFSVLSENEVKGQGHQGQGQKSGLKVIGQGHQDQGHYLIKSSEVRLSRSKSEFKVTRSWSLLGIKVKSQGHLGQN